jgi:hypothetical protein
MPPLGPKQFDVARAEAEHMVQPHSVPLLHG